MKCSDCYFWADELNQCLYKDEPCHQERWRLGNAEECSDAIFDLVWDDKLGEPVRKEAATR